MSTQAAPVPCRAVPFLASRHGAVRFALALVALLGSPLGAATVNSSAPLPLNITVSGGTINTELLNGTTLYLGGSFSSVSYDSGSMAAITRTTATMDLSFPLVDGGTIDKIVSDPAGGWFITGSFTRVGGLVRNGFAHLLSSKAVDPNFNPDVAGGGVADIKIVGNVIYCGGSFTSVSGIARNRIAAVNRTTGLPTSWNPNADDAVQSIVLSADLATVYVGGAFANIGGGSRGALAALSASTGLALPWNPIATGGMTVNGIYTVVRCLYLSGSTMYVGGIFSTLGGQPRVSMGAVDVVTGAATAWNANLAGGVLQAVAFITPYTSPTGGACLFLSGYFATVGTGAKLYARNNLALVTQANGDCVPAFNARAASAGYTYVGETAVSGNSLYCVGVFNSIGGVTRGNLAELNADTGDAKPWAPASSGTITGLSIDTNDVLISGTFTPPTLTRRGLMAVDTVSGAVTAFDAKLNSGAVVNSLAMNGGSLYVGGAFTSVNGTARGNLAAVATSDGALDTTWNPLTNGAVKTLWFQGGQLYAGGLFTSVGGAGSLPAVAASARNFAAAWDFTLASPNVGKLHAWNANISTGSAVNAIVANGTEVYLGGTFTAVGGTPMRNNLVVVDAASGAFLASSFGCNNTVSSLLVANGQIYAGGTFTTVTGANRNRAAAWSLTGRALTAWNPNVSGGTANVLALAAGTGTSVYLGGAFTTAGGSAHANLVCVDATGAAVAWTPSPDNTVRDLHAVGSQVYVAGDFLNAGNPSVACANLALFDLSTAPTGITYTPGSVAENTATTTQVGSVIAGVDADFGETFTYTLADDAGGRFGISGSTVVVANGALLDYETAPVTTSPTRGYGIVIRAIDHSGYSVSVPFTVVITNVNEAPTSLALAGTSVVENAAANTVVGTLSGTDPDAGSTLSFALVAGTGSTDNASFNISGTSLRANAGIDFEAGATRSVRIAISDGSLTLEKVFTISVSDVNEAPTAVSMSATSVLEKSPAGTVVGTVSSTDPDTSVAWGPSSHVYTMTNSAGGVFSLVGNQVRVAAGANLDATVQASYSITLVATDGGNLTKTQAFTITVTPRATPTIAWNNPAAITYGTLLSAVQLNAVATPSAGTYAYTPALNTKLGAGTQTLSVTFTPTDSANYRTATKAVSVVVNAQPLTITAASPAINTGDAIPALTVSYSAFVTGENASNLTGTLSVTTTATPTSPAGTYPVVASGLSSANYAITYVAGTLTISNQVQLISTSSNGAAKGNGQSDLEDLSADGRYVLFTSGATNLVAGSKPAQGLYLNDRQTRTVTLQSAADAGQASMSGDARFLTYIASGNSTYQIFVKDLSTSIVTLESVKSGTTIAADDFCLSPRISDDGRYVAFSSMSTVLSGAPSNPGFYSDVILRDRTTGTTTCISRTPSPTFTPTTGDSFIGDISADGRYIAYTSTAPGLVAGPAGNRQRGVYIYDRAAGTNSRVDIGLAGAAANGRCDYDMHFSPDGRYLAFSSNSSNLVAGDTNGAYDVFVWDRLGSPKITRDSILPDGTQANGDSYCPRVSQNGVCVAFLTRATNLVPDTNGTTVDVILCTRAGHNAVLVSQTLGSPAVQSNGDAYSPLRMTRNAAGVCWYSAATNLISGDANGALDVFYVIPTPPPPMPSGGG